MACSKPPRSSIAAAILSFAPVLAAGVLCTAGRVSAQTPTPAAPTFVHEFGAVGARGSFRVQFDDRGAGVDFVQTMDHFVDADAGHKSPQELGPADFMLLVWSGADASLRVGEPQGEKLFGSSLWTSAWRRTERADAVEYSIESGTGLVLTKTLRHRPDERGFALELRLENRGLQQPTASQMPLQLVGPALLNRHEAALFSTVAYAIAQQEGAPAVHSTADAKGEGKDLLALGGQPLAMAGSSNRFFGGFLFPLDDGARHAVELVRVESLPAFDVQDLEVHAHSMPRTVLDLRLPMPAVGTASTATFGLYLGPKSYHVFDESPEHQRFLPILDVDLEPPCCGVTVPGGKLMGSLLVKLLGWFHALLGQWGLAIMLLTILVRGCLAPLNFKMQKSMREYGKRMAIVKPKLDDLKKRYGDDQKAYQQAMIQFQREHKLIPPIGGCLPVFLTMPIYIGLFTALRTAYDLRQQSFLFMDDLSKPDMLMALPFWPHWFNIMPILWLGLMLTLQLRMPLPTDPQQRQMQQMMRFMPLMFGVMLYNYASGLLVYMVTSMLWTFVESAITKRILGPIDPNAASMAPAPMM